MIYPHNFETKIGFDQIRDLLAQYCHSSLGVEIVDEMSFKKEFEAIQILLLQSEEFIHIINEALSFPTSNYVDLRPILKGMHVEGTWISENALFDLRRSLQTINEIVSFLEKNENDKIIYPALHSLTSDIETFPSLVKDIDQILDKFGRIKDNASLALSKIRKEIAQTAGGISKTLNRILRSVQQEGLVDKDVSPTMRDGRLVIPVAPAHKRKIKGIVHDESATGKTVFIEPAEVVELNNRIRELENDERREVIKILTLFTDSIRPYLPALMDSYRFLGEIDFVQAKAKLAIQIEGIRPTLADQQVIRWYRAFHPLLLISHRKNNKTIIPLDIELEGENRILIISGPNAGGKSVCLKTVGLLQYMVQCGIPIPVDETSVVGIFDSIFIDIGDEQSIENDLSTYSSHLSNMKHFVRNCTEKTILLIDEFGGGTEPQIGGAIAESLLKRFNINKAYGVITTHYQNLKHFAEENQGVINGAMLYDRHQMQPLYTLSIGNPGSSFAIEIARKIGLPEDVIADASELVGSDYVNMDKYLQDIVRDKQYWEKKRRSIRKQEKSLDDITTTYQDDLESIEKERKEIIRKAKADAEHLLAEANAKIENTIRSIRENQAEKEKTKKLREELSTFKSSLKREDEDSDKINRKIEKLKNRETKKKKEPSTNIQTKEPKAIVIGDNVRINGQTTVGEVIDIQKNNAVVAFGVIKSTVKIELLEYVTKNQAKKETRSGGIISLVENTDMREKKLNFKQEIDVRGMRGDEALQAVMYFIDDAILVGVTRVRILHGTGTGALRQMIRDYLKTVHGVTNYHDEHVQFGGAGITVIELA